MNLYEAEYQTKKVTIEEALGSLKDGDVIGTSQCANEPTAFSRLSRPFPDHFFGSAGILPQSHRSFLTALVHCPR